MTEPTETPLLQCPFQKADQLNNDIDSSYDCLPGQPRIKIDDHTSLYNFIRQDVWSEDLEAISSKLWWMSKQDSGNISPLHRQKVKNRNIVITEDPRLHLVWIDNRIFIKPLPKYLTSYSFWYKFLSGPCPASKDIDVLELRKAALGYLRTYFFLIQYGSDLQIAQDPALSLVPKEVTWLQFCRFSANLNDIADDEVSGRYHYGEIRLTRLNYYAPVLLGRAHYQRVNYQYRAYFARMQGPVISAFAFFSILLNCMQVTLAVATAGDQYGSTVVWECCYWFSIMTGIVTCFLLLSLVFLFVFKILQEWRFAIHNRLEWNKDQQRHKSGSEGLHV
jgi:hypothetical protein